MMNKSRNTAYLYLVISSVYLFAGEECTDKVCYPYPFPINCYQYCVKSIYKNHSSLLRNNFNANNSEAAMKLRAIYKKIDNGDIKVGILNHINNEQDLMRAYGEVSNPNDAELKK
ncbi:hypothetical protein [Chitinimonas sp. BJB300]|uniref:hypothetical protein n=1 Tax=Chitinimonas sp. BJB300 TaxID=1559339 RepID=UPI001111C356|nr:hypothetical protein [Chitinimonas sp. BJB300]TSJ88211.1 hypothetical protein FG002_011930 [Chitinimonas sp. BJB300]